MDLDSAIDDQSMQSGGASAYSPSGSENSQSARDDDDYENDDDYDEGKLFKINGVDKDKYLLILYHINLCRGRAQREKGGSPDSSNQGTCGS